MNNILSISSFIAEAGIPSFVGFVIIVGGIFAIFIGCAIYSYCSAKKLQNKELKEHMDLIKETQKNKTKNKILGFEK